MTESASFKIRCSSCCGEIEFPPYAAGEVVECPVCKSSVTLTFPADDAIGPTQQIDALLAATSFPRTRAELLFLKVFTFPTDLRDIRGADAWQQALEEPLDSTVSRFVAVGMLREANEDVASLLQSKSKEELKSLAKARNLPQSGTKQLLAERLFKADPDGMSEFFRGKTYFTCTAKGKLIVDKFIESEDEFRLKAERATESALRSGRHEDAYAIVARFEASRVFRNGIKWGTFEILNDIAAFRSKRHRHIPEPVLRSLRVSAGMMKLWGESKPAKWLTESEREFATEAHAILSAAIARFRLREMRRAGVSKVEVLGSGRDDTCPICRSDDRKTYEIACAPGLPHEDCSCESGCGCLLIAAR